MSTEPKLNIRPGVRGICRNGFWTPPLEATCSTRWPWKAAGMSWSSSGCYRSDGLVDAFDIIGIVEDLPPVPSSQQKSYWRLLEVGEVIQDGDEYFHTLGKKMEWRPSLPGKTGASVDPDDLPRRRRVPEPEPQPESVRLQTAVHELETQVNELELERNQLKSDAAKWREHIANPQPAPSIGTIDRWLKDGATIKAVDPLRVAVTDHCLVGVEVIFGPQPAPQIPGMPKGWEFCQVGKGLHEVSGEFGHIDLVVRRIKPTEPVCTWQHGVFRDGWLCEDQDGEWYWHETMPNVDGVEWVSDLHIARMYGLLTQPKFRDDLPWDQRCVKVGPEAEKGMGQ